MNPSTNNWTQLWLPIYIPPDYPEQMNLQDCAPLPKIPEPVEWTEDDIVRLHIELFYDAIEKLGNPRTSDATLREIIEWIDKPYCPQQDINDNPFSFQLCCELVGVDYLVLHEGIMNNLDSIREFTNKLGFRGPDMEKLT